MLQAEEFNKHGVKAIALTGELVKQDKNVWKRIDKGEYRVLFACPEVILKPGSYFWQRMAGQGSGHTFLGKLAAIVFNECHIIWTWGGSGFRIEYGKVRFAQFGQLVLANREVGRGFTLPFSWCIISSPFCDGHLHGSILSAQDVALVEPFIHHEENNSSR